MSELQRCDAAALEDPLRGGPLWGIACDDLNVTLLSWPVGQGMVSQRNDELDVLWIGIHGEASVIVDGAVHRLAPGVAILLPKGSERSLQTARGVRYYSIHRRHAGLMPV